METGQKISEKNNNIDYSQHNELSIQVSLSGLSFCILNSFSESYTYYKSFNFERKLNPGELLDRLVHQFNTEFNLQQAFKSVSVIHENELSSLVPKSLFNEDHLADYLKFNSKILRTDFITYDSINANDGINVYVPYVNINNYLYDRFGEFEFKHFSTVLLETILNLEKNGSEEKMYAHISDNHFEIIIVKNGQLKLYNTFEYSTKEDFIYYILFTAEQLQLNPEAFPLSLIGNVTKEHDLYKIAYTYIRNVSIIESRSSKAMNEEISTALLNNFILLNSY